MKCNSILAIVAIALLPLAAGAEQTSEAAQDALLRSKSAPSEAFSGPTTFGYVKHNASYSASEPQPLLVYIAVKSAARLYCMNYADFQFDLRDQSGHRVPYVRRSVYRSGRPYVGAVQLSGGSAYAGVRCAYGLRRDALFPFWLDELYPSLKSGTYVLQITFRPRDGSLPETPLPSVSFSIY